MKEEKLKCEKIVNECVCMAVLSSQKTPKELKRIKRAEKKFAKKLEEKRKQQVVESLKFVEYFEMLQKQKKPPSKCFVIVIWSTLQ